MVKAGRILQTGKVLNLFLKESMGFALCTSTLCPYHPFGHLRAGIHKRDQDQVEPKISSSLV